MNQPVKCQVSAWHNVSASTNYYVTNGHVDWVWTFCENYPRT